MTGDAWDEEMQRLLEDLQAASDAAMQEVLDLDVDALLREIQTPDLDELLRDLDRDVMPSAPDGRITP